MNIYFKKWSLLILLCSVFITPLLAQTEEETETGLKFNYAADFVSKYIWRGSEIGEKINIPHLQPSLGLSYSTENSGSLSLSVWSSFGISSDFIETDFSLNYELPTSVGNFGVGIVDYYYPSNKMNFFNFDKHGEGAHTIEGTLSYTCVESFPLRLFVATNIHNDIDEDNSLYVETSFPFELATVSFNLFAGLAKGPSIYYGVEQEKLQFINTGISVSKKIYLSENFSLPVGFDFIYNPYVEKSFLVFKLSYSGN